MLKSLELIGFKSFADRTRFDFHPGITAVVGPNGSGKSNVVDAIKWILGDQSAKSLRGKEMSDVIFNGASGRKPANMAEATLVFDNASGFLPAQTQEVAVGRRIWRSSDAEYLVNRQTSRLRDVRHLFAGTGAGSSSYAIIEQGRVDQILQGNASSRRSVFDEAAGISRYKSRKAEALRKLERVEQNLLRLKDIVEEVETRLTATRNQAAKATKYRKTADELRELWLGLAADSHRHLSAQLGQIEGAISENSSRLEDFNRRLAETEKRLSALDVDIAALDDRLREAEQASAENREAIAGHEATARHLAARRQELQEELGRLQQQRMLLRSRVREVIGEYEQHKRVVERSERKLARRRNTLADYQKQIEELTAELDSRQTALGSQREQIREKAKQVSQCRSQASGLESQLAAALEDGGQAARRLQQADAKIAERRAEYERRRQRHQSARQKAADAERKKSEADRKRQTLIDRHKEFQHVLHELREQRTACRARKNVLEDLERRDEGFGIGVREILERARTSDYPPWNSILGTAADLITVDMQHAALLDVAMGGRAQLIVIEESDALIQYLHGETCSISGRVGFVTPASAQEPNAGTGREEPPGNSLPSAGVSASPRPDLGGRPGVVGRADQFVQCSDRVPRLAEQLLADTWIVDDLVVALKLAAGPGVGCRFVTRQGELLEADGALMVGTVRSEAAIVSRKSELRELKLQLVRLERRIAQEEQRLAGVDDSISRMDASLKAADDEYRWAAEQQAVRAAELAEQQRELDLLQEGRKASEAETERAESRQRTCRDELRQAQQALAAAEKDLQTLEDKTKEAELQQAECQRRLTSLRERSEAQRLKLAKQEERHEGLRASFRRLQDDLDQRKQQRDESERRYETGRANLGKLVVRLLNMTALVNELCLKREQIAENVALLTRQKAELRFSRSRLLQQETEIREQRRAAKDAVHGEEIKARDLRHQIKTLDDRIQEEYQVALSDIVASGASAYERYLQELTTPRDNQTDPSEAVDDAESGSQADGDEQQADRPLPSFQEVREELENRVERLRRRLKTMGNVSTESLQDLDELEDRYARLSSQLADLQEAKATLEEIVRRINSESRRLFTETYESIRGHFRELFRKLFGGGEADIVLEDAEDVLECGIDIVARPPGKELRSLSLLSGGEKTMTAVALLLAIFKSRPSPFCILDEVDAALDEANLQRFVSILRDFRKSTQFIMITHRKPTMTVADVLYGVTMEQSGVSKRMTVRFEDVDENGNFKGQGAPAAGPNDRPQEGRGAAA